MPWTRALWKQRFGPWKSVQANLQKSCWQLPYTVFLVGPWSHSSSGQGRSAPACAKAHRDGPHLCPWERVAELGVLRAVIPDRDEGKTPPAFRPGPAALGILGGPCLPEAPGTRAQGHLSCPCHHVQPPCPGSETSPNSASPAGAPDNRTWDPRKRVSGEGKIRPGTFQNRFNEGKGTEGSGCRPQARPPLARAAPRTGM